MSSSLPIEILKERKTGFTAFFETGTNEGDTVQTAIEAGFEEIYSVELNPDLFSKAQQRFLGRPQVSLMRSESVTALELLTPVISVPTVFFLDAHPDCDQGPSPIMEELAILMKFRHDLLIFADDMRLMGQGKWRYTSEDIAGFLLSEGFCVDFLENGHSPKDLLVAWRCR